MNRSGVRRILIGVALSLGLAGAAIGAVRQPVSKTQTTTASPLRVSAWELAALLSSAPPETVVIALDQGTWPLPGAMPASAYGATDDQLLSAAPKARRIILVGADPVRVERVARRLMASGRDTRVLEGGIQAWDKAMDADPAQPGAGASAAEWDAYRMRVALRSRVTAKDAAPAAPVAAPPPAAAPAGGATPKKREGC